MATENSVPLGQAGTGAAFVLGENQALNQFLENQDYNAQIERQRALLAQKAAADAQKQLQDSYMKNALNVKAGLIFQDVDQNAQKVVEKGKELYQKGINPWVPYTGNDPKVKAEVEELQRNRVLTEAQAQRREAIQPLLLKEMNSFDPAKHTRSSFDKLNEYTQLPLDEAIKRPFPTLEPKLQPNLVLDKVKLGKVGEEMVIGNKKIRKEGLDSGTARAAIVDALKVENGVNDFLKEDLGISGYTIDDLEKLPKTVEAIKKESLDEYKGNPRFREEIAKAYGITSDKDPRFNIVMDYAANKAANDKQKWEGFINSATKNKLAELGSSISILPDYSERDQQIQEENLRLAKARESRLSSGEGSGGVKPSDFQVTTKEFRKKPERDGEGQVVEGTDKVVANFDKFVTVNPTAFATSQLKSAYDVAKGKNTSIDAQASLKLVGMGYTTVKGGKKQLKATVVDPKGKEYLINITDLPLDVRNDKYVKSAIQALGKAPASTTTKTSAPKTTKKTIQGF